MKTFATDRIGLVKTTIAGMAADGLQRRIYLAALLTAALLVTLGWRTAHEINELVERTSQDELTTYAQAIQLNVLEAMNLADFTLKQARKQWARDRTIKTHDEYFEDFPNYRELITQVAIIDRDGYLKSSSLRSNAANTWLGDREHFRVHEKSTKDSIFISAPVIGRISNNSSVQVTRPIFNEQHEFDGVAVISLNPAYIADTLFKGADMQDINVLLVGEDGRIRVSANPDLYSIGKSVSPPKQELINSASADSQVKNKQKYHWQTITIEGYPLQLDVGTPRERIDANISNTNRIALVIVLVLLAALIGYTANIIKVVRDRNSLLLILEESKIKANSANAMKSKFVSSISHELRTPLNGILGFSELIGMSDNLEEAQKYGKTVNKSAEHLHQLVNTLLDLAKIEAGQMEVTKTESSIREICESVSSIHRFSIEKKGLLFNLGVDKNVPHTIFTDRIKLMQILNNLLHNAVKFTDEGAIFLSVTFNNHRWNFSVADTGIGMAPHQLKHIFTRFNNIKLEQDESADRSGAGLGMALCKELIELLGGEIEVQSERGVGSVVGFHIPEERDATKK